MSLIFSGLQRRSEKKEEENKIYEYLDKQITTCTGETNVSKIKYGGKTDTEGKFINFQPRHIDWPEEKEEIKIWTKSEIYLLNCDKQAFLENVVDKVPKILYLFRPTYSCQLAMHFVIKQLTGWEDKVMIKRYIWSNSEKICKYFVDYFYITRSVFRGEFLINQHLIKSGITEAVILALTELMVIQRKNECQPPFVTEQMLQNLGDEFTTTDKYMAMQFERDEKQEVCMHSRLVKCIECTQHFSSASELEDHVTKEHDEKLMCKACELEFTEYKVKLIHVLTICRNTVFQKVCMECDLKSDECECNKTFKILQEAIKSNINQKQNKILQNPEVCSLLIHKILQTKLIKLSHITKGYNEQIDIMNEDEIQNNIKRLMPQFNIEQERIKYIGLNETVSQAELYTNLARHFSNGQQVETHFLDSVKDLCIQCYVQDCDSVFTKQHVMDKHPLCSFAMTNLQNELIHRFASTNNMLSHVGKHYLTLTGYFICNQCDESFGRGQGQINFGILMNHLKSHKDCNAEKCCNIVVNDECKFPLEIKSLAEFAHCLKYHVKTAGDLWPLMQRGFDYKEDKIEDYLKENSIEFGKINGRIGNKEQERTEVKVQFEGEETFLCRNETHITPLRFKTTMAKKHHVAVQHKCPRCAFFCEYQNDMELHFATHTDIFKTKCAICAKLVADIAQHKEKTHPSCVSCNMRFLDRQTLALHEPMCNTFKFSTVKQGSADTSQKSLQMDYADNEASFSSTIIKLLQHSGLPEADISHGTNAIQKFVSESTISKNRARLENVSIRKDDSLFFDLPSFNSADKPNLAKVLTVVGTVAESDKFSATQSKATLNAVVNFESLDVIARKQEKYQLLGSLTEIMCISVLGLHFIQRIIDEVASYLGDEWKNLTYFEIFRALQFLYCPLDLEVFESLVLAYRIVPGESFLEFSSRVFRHLKLCSRLFPPEKRSQYIEEKRCQILKHSMPKQVLEIIIKKELSYTSFSSQELIDHVVSFQNSRNKNKNEEYSQYQVFSVGLKSPKSTIRTEAETQRNKGGIDTTIPKSENSHIGLVNHRGGPSTQGKPEYRNKQTMQQRLERYGINPRNCILCLGPHYKDDCKYYRKGTRYTDTMCSTLWLGKPKNWGFHCKTECNHPNPGSKPQSDRSGYGNNNNLQRTQRPMTRFGGPPMRGRGNNNQPMGFRPFRPESSRTFRPFRMPGRGRN